MFEPNKKNCVKLHSNVNSFGDVILAKVFFGMFEKKIQKMVF
jgi:hypothetical protein